MSVHRVFVDGVEGAGVPVDDPGFTRGWAAFETMRTYGSVIFRPDRHLDRLKASCAAMGLVCPPLQEVLAEVQAVVDTDVWVRYTVTGGGRRVIEVKTIDEAYIGRPRRVASLRMTPSPQLPGFVKHASRGAWNAAIHKLGVDELLLIDRDGHVLEANRSSVIAVIDGTLVTPPDDGRRLRGVTMGAIIEALDSEGIEIQRREFSVESNFEELYISSTLKELAPIGELDGRTIGGGPLGQRAREAFGRLVSRECGI